MAIIDFLKKQFIDILEWTDDSRDTLSWRFPDEDKEIKNGAQLIVRESQLAQFVYLGQFGDAFGPGKHTLTTDNIPILTNLKSWKYALESPFKADVYYVVTRLFAGNKWGRERVYTYSEMLGRIGSAHTIEKLDDDPHSTAKAYRVADWPGTFAVISTVTEPFCGS